MAKKLSDDHLRIILDVEAKGVQAELQKITSESYRLADANKTMASEMKKAEVQIKEAEKAMALLEKAGERGSRAYKEWQLTIESAKEEVADYKTKIEQNTQSIDDNNKKHAEIIKTMSIEDMTMSQLKQRASELQQQMNNTAASLSPEAYKQLQKELEQVNNRIGVVQNTNKSMLQQFAGMHNPIGSAARAVQGFGQALKLLMANPVVAIIAAIVAIFYALKDSISKNEEAMNSLNRIMAPFKSILDSIINAVMGVVNWLLKFAEATLNIFSKFAESIPFIGDKVKEINEESQKAVELEKEKQELQKQHRKNIVDISENEKKIAKLRAEAADKDKFNAKDRISKLEEAKNLELANLKLKQKEAEAELNILEHATDKVKETSEYLDLLAAAKVKLNQITIEYENQERTLNRSISAAQTTVKNEAAESARKAAAAAKKATENRLKEIDKTLKLEINKLKQARMQGLWTEKQYNDKVEELTLKSIENKKKIKGQEAYRLIEYEAQILDAQLKHQEQADKDLLTALKKTSKNQLDLLESRRNRELERLQETESDQKIYALRAAEIESRYAQERLDTLQAFDKIVSEADFKNQQNRLDALQESGDAILKQDEQNLKAQANLRKLFAKTTADFERQYNIKTWEQRKEDELRILEKQYKEGLMSLETKGIAEKAIEKKYADEQLKIREQYGLVSLKEQYNAELEALEEKNRLGLIETEDYEKAQLQIKLKYAQELTQQVQEFEKAGSDAVKSIQEAETAKTEAEYTKRQSALTKQYNEGLISQEEYNSQKEALDYEQKSKELEIQKKYADVNFAIQVAQIAATTAQGIMNAWASAQTYPFPYSTIVGAAMTALLGVTSIAQIAKAKAERDRVKAMTLESPGGSTEAPKTGARVLKPGFADGGYNDMSAGGYTGQGGKYEVAGYVPVHHGEYIVDAESLKYPDVMDKVRSIEQVRRRHASSNPLPAGFAEGGSNSPANHSPAYSSGEMQLITEMRDLLRDLKINGVKAPVVLTELQRKEELQRHAQETFRKSN